MTIALGIDTGGTYTDAVLLDYDSGAVLDSAKALTTRHDLAIGIGQAVRAVFNGRAESAGSAIAPGDVELVSLSTTLATNAIVEGQGTPVCLLLIGYDPSLISQYGFEHELVTNDVVYLRGGHDLQGDEVESLDEDAAREAILSRRGDVESFAVSGYFGVRNPEHELRVCKMIEDLTNHHSSDDARRSAFSKGVSITCGHDLTTRLNSVRRATTTALNAKLIPLLQDLIATVRHTLDDIGIDAPLMVVKGDGSLVRAEWAMHRPIETILSGPAASAVGAAHLVGNRDTWVIDVGGTTTDIAELHEGLPKLSREGAQVGGWKTMVNAVDMYTAGLGGDSHVRLGESAEILIGPRRVAPLCWLADEHPAILAELQRQAMDEPHDMWVGQFVMLRRKELPKLPAGDKELLNFLVGGPRSIISLLDKVRYRVVIAHQIKELVAQRVVLQAGFTPTDALHVLGRLQLWNAEAARLGANLLARQAGMSTEEFCTRVVEGVSYRAARELVSKVLDDEVGALDWNAEPLAAALLNRALGQVTDSGLDCRWALKKPIIAIGAPVEAYMPRVAEMLNTELIIPTHAEVANAVGAVVGGVVQQMEVKIQPLSELHAAHPRRQDNPKAFRVHLPEGVYDCDSVEEGVAYTYEVIPEQLKEVARQAGAEQVEIKITREDQNVPVRGGWGGTIYFGTTLTFTAVGRPSPARRYEEVGLSQSR